MEVIVECASALDVHKKSITVCVRTPSPDGSDRVEQVRTYPTFLRDLEAMRDWLVEQKVTQVAMEATGSYWRPVWRVLEEEPQFDELLLVNARHVKQVPGRKTDVKDACWLCQLLEVGLLAPSFVPTPEIRRLRQATRHRKKLIRDRTADVQRVEKVLEDAVVKIGAVASSTLTKSGRAMIEALIGGERDPETLADLAKARLRNKIPELMRALDARFDEHHAVQLRELLDHIDWLDAAIDKLNVRIAAMTAPWAELIERLQTIPGVGRKTAEVIVAETGADMSQFPDHLHLASWVGLSPGHNESGGKRRSGRTTHGNVWLADALTEAAWAAVRTKDTYLAAKFRRVAGPRADGNRRKKAAVAVAHKILIAAYHIMAIPEEVYRELGGDYLTGRDNPERRRDRLVAQLTKLGYDVDLTPTPTTA